jgi:hypothetical protein
MSPTTVEREVAISMAPRACSPSITLPLSRRATEPVRRPAPAISAIVAAWALAIFVIVLVCVLV